MEKSILQHSDKLLFEMYARSSQGNSEASFFLGKAILEGKAQALVDRMHIFGPCYLGSTMFKQAFEGGIEEARFHLATCFWRTKSEKASSYVYQLLTDAPNSTWTAAVKKVDAIRPRYFPLPTDLYKNRHGCNC